MDTERKIGQFIGFFMSLVMGFVFSLVNSLLSGHFEITSWLVSFGVSFVLALIIGRIVPMGKIDRGIHKKIKSKPAAVIVSGFVSNLIYSPLMTAAMTYLMITLALHNMNGSIAILRNQKTIIQTSYSQLVAEYKGTDSNNTERLEEIQKSLSEMDGTMKEIQQQINGIEKSKPDMKESMIRSEIMNCIIGLFLCIIMQPIGQKLAFMIFIGKKQGKPETD
ncbi:MAG: DUF2798 domain-containing protein [Ruminococcus sp.]|nr:DUF2798 domain-containing protein [Ruminococcus sp.]